MESDLYIRKNQCRVCGHAILEDILSLGDLYVTNFVDGPEGGQIRSPLDLVLCNREKGGCGLLQLRHTFSADEMYRHYWYRSGINKTMTNELNGIARTVELMTPLALGDHVIDIGSNDSTLLRSYSVPGIRLVGFEPSKNLMLYAKEGVTEVVNDYFSYQAWKKIFGGIKAKAITAIAMFYDLDDPLAFMNDVSKCLDDDGVFIVQQNYLPYMIERNVFDNISHEHLEYYSLTTFKYLMDKFNLEIFDVELNDVNGGSMRTYVRHRGRGRNIRISQGADERVRKILKDEESKGLNDKKTYEDFAKRVIGIKKTLYDFVDREVGSGKKIHAYGASTRGNTLLQYCGLDKKLITAAAERNPDKWGKKTVGTLIPIISEDQARRESPDYFLVLPWQFLDEFIERESAHFARGKKFIVPLPLPRIISSQGEVHLA